MSNNPNTKQISVELPNGMKLVAECDKNSPWKEIYVGLVNKENVWCQDLAIIRGKYEYKDDGDGEVNTISDKYEVLVYADNGSEDYTHKFEIDQYTEEE